MRHRSLQGGSKDAGFPQKFSSGPEGRQGRALALRRDSHLETKPGDQRLRLAEGEYTSQRQQSPGLRCWSLPRFSVKRSRTTDPGALEGGLLTVGTGHLERSPCCPRDKGLTVGTGRL